MANKLLQKDLLLAALIARGYNSIETRSTKYTVVQKGGSEKRIFIGEKGALRVGSNASNSISVSEEMRQRLLEEGRVATTSKHQSGINSKG